MTAHPLPHNSKVRIMAGERVGEYGTVVSCQRMSLQYLYGIQPDSWDYKTYPPTLQYTDSEVEAP